jgi:hypothetical protein
MELLRIFQTDTLYNRWNFEAEIAFQKKSVFMDETLQIN